MLRCANDDGNATQIRYISENQVDPISIISGLVQTGLYLDFFYGSYSSLKTFVISPYRGDAKTDSEFSYSCSHSHSLLYKSYEGRKVRVASMIAVLFRALLPRGVEARMFSHHASQLSGPCSREVAERCWKAEAAIRWREESAFIDPQKKVFKDRAGAEKCSFRLCQFTYRCSTRNVRYVILCPLTTTTLAVFAMIPYVL